MTADASGIDDANSAALMLQYGITRVPADTFHLGEWRYSNLSDAIAQARRLAASARSTSK